VSETLRLNRSLTYETFPHRCLLGELEFWIDEFAINGDQTVEPDDDRRIDLTEYPGWSEIEFTLSVEIPPGLLGEVLPEASEEDGGEAPRPYPAHVIVAGHCVETYTRAGTVLGTDVSTGVVSDTLKINAYNLAGRLSLRPLLLRSEPLDDEILESLGLDESHNYATARGALLSDGSQCRIDIEEEALGSDDVLQVERTSFEQENEEDESPFPSADRMYYLDLKRDPENPVLYFNEDHEQIVDIVWNGEGTYDELTAELIWDHVMSGVWARMLQIAAEEYNQDSNEWTPEWQPAVFEMMTPHLYDDGTSPEKAAEFLQEQLNESPLTATEQIEHAVQGLLNPAQQLDNHVRRVGSR
jgi:hypothetical protein